MPGQNVVGSAFIQVGLDTSKVTPAAMGAIGKTAGTTLGGAVNTGISQQAEASSGAWGKFASAAKGALGSVMAPIADLGEHFTGLGNTIRQQGVVSAAGVTAIGTATLGAGVALMAMGSADAAAQKQLQASIQATGQDYADFKDKIEANISAEERHGTTAAKTMGALQVLTTVTGDAGKATDLLSTAADLAAAKHTSLDSAARAVGRAAEGNTRLFKQYGIEVQKNADGTANIDGALQALSARLSGQANASVDSFTGRLKVMSVQVEDQVAKFGQRWGPTITAVGAAMGIVGGIAQLMSRNVREVAAATELATTATEADIGVTGQSTVAISGETAAVQRAAVVEGEHTVAAGAAAKAVTAEGVSVGAARGQLELFSVTSMQATAAQERLAVAETEAGTAGKAGFLKMAAGGAIATVAIVGIGLVVNHFMQQSKKQAEENKKAFDEFWSSVSANRNQNSLSDLTAEAKDLTDAIAKQKAEFDAGAGSSTEFTRAIDKQIEHSSPYAKQLDELNKKIATSNQNVDDLTQHYHMNRQAVEDLALANGVDLSGAYDGIQKKFDGLLGGTAAQVTQMTLLTTSFHQSKQAVEDFASSQKITLDGTYKSTAALKAAYDNNKDVGGSFQILREDTDKLYSSFSTVVDKATALKGILDELIGTNISSQEAMDKAQKAVNDLGTALDKTNHTIVGNSDVAINNRSALRALALEGATVAETIYKQTGNLGKANAAYGEYYNKLSDAAKAQGISKDSLDGLLHSVGALPSDVQDALSGMYGVGVSAGDKMIAGMGGAIKDSGPTISSAAAEQVPRYLDKAGGLLYIGGVAIGKGLDDGMAAGIDTNAAIALYQAELMAQQVIGKVRNTLKMQSPSRVMMELGGYVAQGLALGITGGAPSVAKAAGGLASGIAGAFGANPTLATSGPGAAGSRSSAAIGPDATAALLREIANYLAQVADNTASIDGKASAQLRVAGAGNLAGLTSELIAGRRP